MEEVSKQFMTVLGSTGSIGVSTLAVVRENTNVQIYALTAHKNFDMLLAQCLEFSPEYAVLVDPVAADEFAKQLKKLGSETECLQGTDALEKVSYDTKVTTVMSAILGAAALNPTLAAARSGKKILLANKESIVMSGELLLREADLGGSVIIPIDSEHNAIFQCLPPQSEGSGDRQTCQVKKIVLTASGGPFLNASASQLASVSPEQACNHPRWNMGKKISVDSATLMNKGLEFIEASYLFDLNANDIEVIIHPESIIHSMVHFCDGSVLAQMGTPDMRIPIAYGIAWPKRFSSGADSLDLVAEETLSFSAPDLDKFPCLTLGIEAAMKKGTMPAILNAANEVSVEAFLSGRISFTKIFDINLAVINQMPCQPVPDLDAIFDADHEARQIASTLI